MRQIQINTVGNSLVSSAYIAYLGQLTQPYRDRVLQPLSQLFQSSAPAVPCHADTKLASIAGDPVELKEWSLMLKLPADNTLVDNACIWKLSRKWPLFIDPEDLALHWVRALEDDLATLKEVVLVCFHLCLYAYD